MTIACTQGILKLQAAAGNNINNPPSRTEQTSIPASGHLATHDAKTFISLPSFSPETYDPYPARLGYAQYSRFLSVLSSVLIYTKHNSSSAPCSKYPRNSVTKIGECYVRPPTGSSLRCLGRAGARSCKTHYREIIGYLRTLVNSCRNIHYWTPIQF